ncbi:hypothetical protein [Endozoicomonas sp. ONNA2]|uniref:hypothetical protein n=1 Tax=Endozoicomonas sp. ONNA2 TaxID=2828741 RepID=UPI00214823A8|nr:hypothetical protein [Endozoicomonas sp. ONNA2]
MNFDNINLRPDFPNFFSTDSQDTKSEQVDFASFHAGISPPRTPTHLSAGGTTTGFAECDDNSRFENVGAVSSDEAVSHLKVAHASPANTGKVCDQNGKFPVEFIQEMTNLVLEKDRFKPEDLSQIKEEKEALPFLLTPDEPSDENNILYSEYLKFINPDNPEDELEVKGVLSLETLVDYTPEPGTEPEIKAIYSYCDEDWDIPEDYVNAKIVFGILKSGEPFKFNYCFDVSCQESSPSLLTIAPDWNSLIAVDM